MSESCLLNKPFMLKPGHVSSDDCETWISAFFTSILQFSSLHIHMGLELLFRSLKCLLYGGDDVYLQSLIFFSWSWRPLFGSFWVFLYLESYASSVCTYCSLFPRMSSALTLPLCLPGSLHLFLMIICWKVIVTIISHHHHRHYHRLHQHHYH